MPIKYMKNFSFSSEIVLLQKLVSHLDFPLIELVQLSIELLEECSRLRKRPTTLKIARKAIKLGAKAIYESEHSISFTQSIKETLLAKAHRRSSTLAEIRYVTNRLMRIVPKLGRRSVRSITTQDWEAYINEAFNSSRQQRKARMIVHGIYAVMVKRNWCSENPLAKMDSPPLKECRVKVLLPKEVKVLINMVAQEYDGSCLPPAAVMLYAGVRPREVQRLTWQEINLNQNIICLSPSHAKTGGARHITIEPILGRILKKYKGEHKPALTQNLCPPNWRKKWENVRKKAGWNTIGKPWVQDCLRHTYASYHALHYKDFTRLQYEMGHASSTLLRTRYLNMGALKSGDAMLFWEEKKTKAKENP